MRTLPGSDVQMFIVRGYRVQNHFFSRVTVQGQKHVSSRLFETSQNPL